DNTPSVMILPTSIFDFLQESDDYYFPAVVGTYLRIVRLLTILTSLVLPPLWYLLIQNAEGLPEWLSFILPKESYSLPIYFQLLMGELMVDGLKLASLNTPNALSNSFSIVAGLILGDFAVQMGLFVPQIILLISFSALASFAQPSYELGYANKFMRLITLTLTALFGLWGFIAGFIVMIVLILTNKTVPGGRGYLYPLIPFNFRGLKRLFTRATLR
ncbi:MAG: spore germination protein, partial [Clostridia bacterium]|nr:spore germination protein [Clostridia bacterium]